jgi:hypothetical protein
MSETLWANSARIVLFTLNRIRRGYGWPRSLPEDQIADIVQEGLIAAHNSLQTWRPDKSEFIPWIIPNLVRRMTEEAWKAVKGGINTNKALHFKSLSDSVAEDFDLNDDSWILELSYDQPSSDLTIPDGEPTSAAEVRNTLNRVLGPDVQEILSSRKTAKGRKRKSRKIKSVADT